jgi:hypothetical protein
MGVGEHAARYGAWASPILVSTGIALLTGLGAAKGRFRTAQLQNEDRRLNQLAEEGRNPVGVFSNSGVDPR